MSWPEAIAIWAICILWGVYMGLERWPLWYTFCGASIICVAGYTFVGLVG